jgi:hypothetical protein
MSNRLCRASIQNPNSKSSFSAFEVITVREFNDYNGGTYLDEVNTAAQFLDSLHSYDDPFYRVYGIYRHSIPKSRRFIADFWSHNDAIKFIEELVGEEASVHYY